ncbi:hypothetical protein ABZ412_19615 [Nocardia sp. NPDC005746]|uniref:DUF7373 family lipoprotein n=1 Tax=Nocardia sp. NPDC005746 TaxID=3157062 RepID=UPI0033CCD6B5
MRHGHGRLRSARLGVRAAAAAALAISVVVSAGCGSESHAAEEKPAELSKLDTGNYPTKPQDPIAADPAKQARILEAARLGNILPLGSEIDPTLARNGSGVHIFTEPNTYDGILNVDHFAEDAAGFVVGFATSARPADDVFLGYTLTNTVMIFDSDAAAANAANALVRHGFWLSQDGAVVDSLHSAQHPAAQIIWAPTEQRLASWYPTGKFVIFTMFDLVENRSVEHSFGVAPEPAPLALADKAIDVTTERLKTFQPTPPDKLASLPLDPDGMLRVTLPRPAGDQTSAAFTGTLDRQGMLHVVENPAKYRDLFEKTGVDSISDGAGFLVRAKDSDSAQTFLDSASASRYQHRIDPPAGLPNAHCVKYHGPDDHAAPFHCYVAYGRYAATVWSQQQQDVYQRISAQYAILANNK